MSERCRADPAPCRRESQSRSSRRGVVDDVERLADLPMRATGPCSAAGLRVRSDLALERRPRGRISPQVPDGLVRLLPIGTSGSAGFGIRRSASSTAPSTSASSASRAVIRSPAASDAAFRSATSGTVRCRAALDRLADPLRAAFRSALRASLSPSGCRRRASSSSARSTTAGSSPLSTPLADDLRLIAGAAAARRSRDRPRQPPASLARAMTKAGSRLASSQPARGPFGRSRNAR